MTIYRKDFDNRTGQATTTELLRGSTVPLTDAFLIEEGRVEFLHSVQVVDGEQLRTKSTDIWGCQRQRDVRGEGIISMGIVVRGKETLSTFSYSK